jgi:hypothetical protein
MKTHSTNGPLQLIIIVLTALIALIHMSLLFPDVLFLLNGIGYLVLVTLLYLPWTALDRIRRYIRWLLIAYTAATIVFWVFWGSRLTFGYVAVVCEILLIALLVYDGYRAHWSNSPASLTGDNEKSQEPGADR